MAPRRLTIPPDAPARLDAFLAKALPGYGKGQIQKLLADGKVKVNGTRAKPLRRVHGGETVELDLPNVKAPAPASNRRLEVLHESPRLAVVFKPAGLVVEDEGRGESVESILAAQLKGLDVGGRHVPGIVHRLDKDTTGCLLVAKDDETVARLKQAFDEKRITKTYLALVHGAPPDERSLDQPYGRHPEDPRRYTTRFPSARRARLSWKKLRQLEGTALLEIALDTGRTHQIRAQLADAGFPLVGDWLYGTREAKAQAPRILLHAVRLALADPDLGFAVEAPVPPDLKVI